MYHLLIVVTLMIGGGDVNPFEGEVNTEHSISFTDQATCEIVRDNVSTMHTWLYGPDLLEAKVNVVNDCVYHK